MIEVVYNIAMKGHTYFVFLALKCSPSKSPPNNEATTEQL